VEASSIWWYPNSISVGTGAIWGFMVQYGLLLTNAFPKAEKNTNDDWIYVGINTLGLTGGIDNAAHIGGLLSGALIGIILYKLDDGRKTAYTAKGSLGCKCQRTLSCRTEPSTPPLWGYR
jgi:rhomboid protease GluP